MSKLTAPILCLVVLSLAFIHGILASGMIQTNDRNTQISQQVKQLSERERQVLKNLLPGLMHQIAQQTRATDGDDYHSNIDLDRLNEVHRYELIDSNVKYPGSVSGRNYGDDYESSSSNVRSSPLKQNVKKLDKSRLLPRDPQYEFEGRILPGTRQFDILKEDKDYGFVGLPMNYNSLRATTSQDFAAKAGTWASELLRDLAAGQQNRARNYHDSKLSQQRPREETQISNDRRTSAEREKRRRCKVDPNLGVKNPSFCDTDAYFGAADYSMRDVWESAGRK